MTANGGFGNHYGRKKVEDVITALVCTGRINKASVMTGVPERTIYRWLTEEEFNRKYTAAKLETYGEGRAIAGSEYANTIRAAVKKRDDPNATDAAWSTSMKLLADHGRAVADSERFDKRLSVIEAKIVNTGEGATTEITIPNSGGDWIDQPQEWQQ